MQLLCFVPDLPPKLLTVENAREAIEAIEFLLGTTRVRVFATDSSATLGFSAADSTQEESAYADDEGGEYTLLRPTENFLVLAGEFEGAQVPASAPRNVDLSWAPLAAWVPLCPHALDLASDEDRERLKLGSLSPLQVELVLDRFAPQLSDNAVVDIMSAHPDGAAWMAEWD